MSTPNIRKFTAQHALIGDWRGSASVNIEGFTVQEVEVPFTPKYSGRGLEVGVDMNDPMIKALMTPKMLAQFLSYIGHAFRVGQDQGFKKGVAAVRSELGEVLSHCDDTLDERTAEQQEVDEYLRYKQPSPPVNPLLDDASARELFEGSNIVCSTPRA
jgi:hypothetical protein